MSDDKKTNKPLNARERLKQATIDNNSVANAEKLNPIAETIKNNSNNDESSRIAKLEKQLAEQKKINAQLNISHMMIAPTRLPDRTAAIDYPFKVFPETMDYIDRNSRGSKNIVFNYLITEGIKVVEEILKDSEIALDSAAKPTIE